jgi:hypothetical protein
MSTGIYQSSSTRASRPACVIRALATAQLAAGPNLFSRESRQTVVHQIRDHACVEAVRAQQRLRSAIADRGREHGEGAALLGIEARRARIGLGRRPGIVGASGTAPAANSDPVLICLESIGFSVFCPRFSPLWTRPQPASPAGPAPGYAGLRPI